MLLDNGQKAELYNYNEKLLKILASGTKIQSVNLNGKNVYKIDGTYYFYREGKFEIAFIEDYDLYVTQYETDTSSFKVSTFNKEEHDKFCLAIDSQSDEEAEKSLLEMSNDPYNMKRQYPTLLLKRINK